MQYYLHRRSSLVPLGPALSLGIDKDELSEQHGGTADNSIFCSPHSVVYMDAC